MAIGARRPRGPEAPLGQVRLCAARPMQARARARTHALTHARAHAHRRRSPQPRTGARQSTRKSSGSTIGACRSLPTSAPGLGSPSPTSAPGLGSPPSLRYALRFDGRIPSASPAGTADGEAGAAAKLLLAKAGLGKDRRGR
jgi:hypothetical protein